MSELLRDSSTISKQRELFAQKLQTLLDQISENREAEGELKEKYRDALQTEVDGAMERINTSLTAEYSVENAAVQKQVDGLYITLETVAGIEVELQQFKRALGALCMDVNVDESPHDQTTIVDDVTQQYTGDVHAAAKGEGASIDAEHDDSGIAESPHTGAIDLSENLF